MSLKLYSALIKRDKSHKIEDIALVAEKFSALAFFFSLPWFLCHKMWQSSLILVLAEILLIKMMNYNVISGFDFALLEIALVLLVAMNANYWYGKYLRKKGYKETSYVLAQNEEEARLKAMKSLHYNSPTLSFDEFSEEIIDPDFYLKSVKPRGVR